MKKISSLLLIVTSCLLFFCVDPASSAKEGWVNIYGSVTYNGSPVCAMVLANGQYMFTCSGGGSFDLDVPLDSNGQITVFTFCSGLAPFKKVIYPSEGFFMDISLEKAGQGQGMDVRYSIQAVNSSRVRLTGNVYYNDFPVNAMVLANGQYMFSSSKNGSFSMDIPLDKDGGVTLFCFCSGLSPYKEEIPYNSIDFFEDNDMDGVTVYQGDCNDFDPSIHPWAAEICGDKIDQDCNGSDLPCTLPPGTFHLYDEGYFDPGYNISFSLSGNSNKGDKLDGTISIATRNTVFINGTAAIPQEVLIQLRNINTGAFSSEIGTVYMESNTHKPIKMILQTSGLTYYPTKISEPTEIAEIGDFGETTSWVANDGSSISGSWLLEDAGNNLAYYIDNSIYKYSNGNIFYTEKMTFQIDETGDIMSVIIEIWYPENNTLVTLYGNKIS